MSDIVYSSQVNLTGIEQLIWKNRVILINSSDKSNAKTDEYKKLFNKYKHEINERDLIWFIIKEADVITNYPTRLSTNFIQRTKANYPIEKHPVLLIGKDGGIKTKSKKLDIDILFNEVDVMPMRQQEMSRQK